MDFSSWWLGAPPSERPSSLLPCPTRILFVRPNTHIPRGLSTPAPFPPLPIKHGHDARTFQANVVPVVASNRVGREEFSVTHINFYGSSFIANQTGEVVSECSYVPGLDAAAKDAGAAAAAAAAAAGADAPRKGGSMVKSSAAAGDSGDSRHFCCGSGGGEVILHTFDLESVRLQRAGWGLFRDRRPSLYRPLLSLDGKAAV